MRSELLFVRASFVSFSELLMTSILIIAVKKLLFSLLCHLLQTPKQIKLKYCNRFALVLWLFACVSCFSVRKKRKSELIFVFEEKRVNRFNIATRIASDTVYKRWIYSQKIKAKCIRCSTSRSASKTYKMLKVTFAATHGLDDGRKY